MVGEQVVGRVPRGRVDGDERHGERRQRRHRHAVERRRRTLDFLMRNILDPAHKAGAVSGIW